MATKFKGRVFVTLLTVGLLASAGCSSMGPGTLTRDRFDYTTALGDTEKEQLLINIVRLRYLDAPVFLKVDSIINQYSREGTVSLGAGFNSAIGTNDSQSLGGTGRWSDRPTITYTPLSGRTFAQNLLTPVPPDALLALVQAGWSAETLFRLAVRSVNGISNDTASPASRRNAAPEFEEFLEIWSQLREAGVIGLRREETEARAFFLGYIDDGTAPATQRMLADRLRALLGLDSVASEFVISYGLVPDEPGEIVMLTSSILEILSELAWRVDVPSAHIASDRTAPSFEESNLFSSPLFRVRFAETKPEDAYVAVFERGFWFCIDDGDPASKRSFALLQVLLSLTESSNESRGPVVTIGG